MLPEFPLFFGQRNGSILKLRLALTLLGLKLLPPRPAFQAVSPQPVSNADLYDSQTETAVRSFQQSSHLPITGIVDGPTWSAIFSEVASSERFAVGGFVTYSDGTPAAGATVSVEDQDFAGKEQLFTTQCDAGGFYVGTYAMKSALNREMKSADAVGTAEDSENKVKGTSDVHYQVQPVEVISIELDGRRSAALSEFERLSERISRVALDRQDRLIPPARWSEEQIGFLALELEEDRTRIVLFAESQLWSGESEVAPELFYGVLRQLGIDALPTVQYLGRKRIFETAKEAIAANIVPSQFGRGLEPEVEKLLQWLTRTNFEAENRSNSLNLRHALAENKRLTDRSINAFINYAVLEGRPPFSIQPSDISDLEQRQAEEISYTLQVARLIGNIPGLLTKVIASRRGDDPRDSIIELLELDAAGWQRLSDTNAPLTDEEGKNLVAKVRAAFPTQAIALDMTRDPGGDQEVSTFLKTNPNFNIFTSDFFRYLAEEANWSGIADKDAVTARVKAFGRAFRLTPTNNAYHIAKTLVSRSLESTRRFPSNYIKFRRLLGSSLNDNDAKTVFWRAQGQLLNTLIGLQAFTDLAAGTSITLPALKSRSDQSTTRSSTRSGTTGSNGSPTLGELFGPLNGCACEHCSSVLSPSAYFADLLEYLNFGEDNVRSDGTPFQGLANPVEMLFDRRPDLKHYELSCANANTRLPYIDLVNEVLELVASTPEDAYRLNRWRMPSDVPPPPLGAVATEAERSDYHAKRTAYHERIALWQTDGEGPEAELRLRTEPKDNQGAYDELYVHLSKTHFPWLLPFDLNAERISLFARQLGLDRARLAHRLHGPGPDVAALTLGLNAAEARLLADPREIEVWRLWGTSEHDFSELRKLTNFLQAAKLDYAQFEALLRSRFVERNNAGAMLAVVRGADPCNIDDFQLPAELVDPVNWDALDQLHRFLRLRYRLNWTVQKLDDTLKAFSLSTIDRTALTRLGELVTLAASQGIEVDDAVGWFGHPQPWEQLAKSLKLASDEVEVLFGLAGLSPPFSDPVVLREVLELWSQLESSGLGVYEFQYILHHKFDPQKGPAGFGPNDGEIADLLIGLRETIADAVEEEGNDRSWTFVRPAEMSDEDWAAIQALADTTISESLAATIEIDRAIIEELLFDKEDGRNARLRTSNGRNVPAVVALNSLFASEALSADAVTSEQLMEDAGFADARAVIIRLQKAARLARAFGLNAHGLALLDPGLTELPVAPPPPPDPNVQKLDSVAPFAQFKLLREKLPLSELQLSDYLGLVRNEGIDEGLRRLARETGWALTDIEAFRQFRGTVRDLSFFVDLLWTIRQAQVHRQSVQQFLTWVSPSYQAEEARTVANRMRDEFRTRFNNDLASLSEVLTPAMDRLRHKKRDALVAYVTAYVSGPDGSRFGDANALYDYYLIDTQMSSCMPTTRLKLATSSVHLFVQRLLLGTEDDLQAVPPDLDRETATALEDHWRQWDWRCNYRVWEANRNVFLFPENWIEPDLLDLKSELFESFEQRILQGPLTKKRVEEAIEEYLRGLLEVSHLDIRAIEEEHDFGTLHVFGRTFSNPKVHYYCTRRDTNEWTPWQTISASIEGDHLVPLYRDGRLHLLWPTFQESKDLTMGLAWTEYRNGAWAPERRSSSRLTIDTRLVDKPSIPHFSLYPIIETDDSGPNILLNVRYHDTFSFETDRMTAQVILANATWNACTNDIFFEDFEDISSSITAIRHFPTKWLPRENFFVANDSEGVRYFGSIGNPPDQFAPHVVLASFQVPQQPSPPRLVLSPSLVEGRFSGERGRFVYADSKRVLLGSVDKMAQLIAAPQDAPDRYQFDLFYHPYACELVSTFYSSGIQSVYYSDAADPSYLYRQLKSEFGRIDQVEPPARTSFENDYVVSGNLHGGRFPVEQFEFDYSKPYSLYNWELFLFIPFLVATRASQDGQFEEARRFFHFIFDPTDSSAEPRPARFWRTKPFFQLSLTDGQVQSLPDLMQRMESNIEQITAWANDPFNPHKIARLRPLAYMKAVVQKYLDNLLAWADDLFRQDTIETINEATQLYIMVEKLLGDRPVLVPSEKRLPATYAELELGFDAFGNAWELAEDQAAEFLTLPSAEVAEGLGLNLHPYFCIPSNEKLAKYWETIDDRLNKIRNCMDITGRVRDLRIQEDPIDPDLLVRARAMGIDLRQALRMVSSAELQHYRYQVHLQQALELAGNARELEGSMLATVEKMDAEALAKLRTQHEKLVLEELRAVKEQQIKDARKAREALIKQRVIVATRKSDYESRTEISRLETSYLSNLSRAQEKRVTTSERLRGGDALSIIPNFSVHTQGFASGTSFSLGGSNLANALRFVAGWSEQEAIEFEVAAQRSSAKAGYDRRQEDWNLQIDQAQKEIEHLDVQIEAADIRIEMVSKELENHIAQIERARQVLEFFKQKFSNQQLYRWMKGQVASLQYQMYSLAQEVAQRAEAAANFELGRLPSSGDMLQFVRFDNWDQQRAGIGAASALSLQLRRLDDAYRQANERVHELTRHISLGQLDPGALLALKETGTCTFDVPEVLFDLDQPGHYMRRIKALSLTIPCIAGPYTTVSAQLTLAESRIRVSPVSEGGYAETPDEATAEPPQRFRSMKVPVDKTATSSAQRDAGVFELRFDDPRYLPFEGAGAISRWRLELPGRVQEDGGKPIRQFDYDTITDIVMHMQYTAKDGGEVLRGQVERELANSLNTLTKDGLHVGISAAREQNSAWHRFLHPRGAVDDFVLELELSKKQLPYYLSTVNVSVSKLTLALLVKDEISPANSGSDLDPLPIMMDYVVDDTAYSLGSNLQLEASRTEPRLAGLLAITRPIPTGSIIKVTNGPIKLRLTISRSALGEQSYVTRDEANRAWLDADVIQDVLLVAGLATS